MRKMSSLKTIEQGGRPKAGSIASKPDSSNCAE